MKVVSFLAVVMGSLIWGSCNCAPAVNCQRDFNPATDSVYHVSIDGKDMAFPLVHGDTNFRIYQLEIPFTENDTTFLYREYSFYRCDTCTTFKKEVSSYYIVPRNHPEFRKHLRQTMDFFWEEDSVFSKLMMGELTDFVPTLIHNDLGDMPRYWYQVVKYDGQYYLSADFSTVIALRDSVEAFYGMELGFAALSNVSRQGDTYSYEIHTSSEKSSWFVKQYTPVKEVKGLWRCTVTSLDNERIILYVTNDEEANNFDLIEWNSNDNNLAGLSRYEEIVLPEK